MAINNKKYQNAILYLCQQQGGALYGKKKLAKLLYYLDFDRYEYKESTKSVTGDIYKALPMGPFPEHMAGVVQTLAKNGRLKVGRAESSPGYHPTEVYECKADPDMSVFDEEEKTMLKRVATRYGHLNGKQLEDLTHAEAPYVGTKLSDEIAYDLAFYRGTDFNELSTA
jgi:uncharacterized phage-associated protein